MPKASEIIRQDIQKEAKEMIRLYEGAARLYGEAYTAHRDDRKADGDAAAKEAEKLGQRARHIQAMIDGKEVVLKAVEAAENSGALPNPG